MAGQGTLRLAELALKNVNTPLSRNCLCLIPKSNATFATCVRRMGSHKRTMKIRPTNYEYQKWKDHLHFYTLLGLVPVTIVVGGANLFLGQAELAELPEDYSPRHWEYHKNPISRFLAKYWWISPEEAYEEHMHQIHYNQKKAEMRGLERKVKALMAKNQDYKGWYYVPSGEKPVFDSYYSKKSEDREQGTNE